MKKLLPLVLICLIGFYACKKDSDSSKTIVGKWTIAKAVYIKIVNGADSVVQVDADIDHSQYIQFNKDGTGVSPSDGNNVNFRYTLSGNNLSITAGDSLSVAFTVKTLTSKSLVLRQSEEAGFYSDTYFTK